MHPTSPQARLSPCSVSPGFSIWQLNHASAITLVRLHSHYLTHFSLQCLHRIFELLQATLFKKCFIKINQGSEEGPKEHQPHLKARILFIRFIGKFFCVSSVVYQANEINLQLEWTVYFISDCESKGTNLIKRHIR